jgi:hypothetical protein
MLPGLRHTYPSIFWVLLHGACIFMWSFSNLLAGKSCPIKRAECVQVGFILRFLFKSLVGATSHHYLQWVLRLTCNSEVGKKKLEIRSRHESWRQDMGCHNQNQNKKSLWVSQRLVLSCHTAQLPQDGTPANQSLEVRMLCVCGRRKCFMALIFVSLSVCNMSVTNLPDTRSRKLGSKITVLIPIGSIRFSQK